MSLSRYLNQKRKSEKLEKKRDNGVCVNEGCSNPINIERSIRRCTNCLDYASVKNLNSRRLRLAYISTVLRIRGLMEHSSKNPKYQTTSFLVDQHKRAVKYLRARELKLTGEINGRHT